MFEEAPKNANEQPKVHAEDTMKQEESVDESKEESESADARRRGQLDESNSESADKVWLPAETSAQKKVRPRKCQGPPDGSKDEIQEFLCLLKTKATTIPS
jgi:hypothetical protein